MPDEYRQRFSDFHTSITRDLYLFHIGRQQASERYMIWRENSDLFSPTSIAELRRKQEESASSGETERAGLARLLAFAIEGHLILSLLGPEFWIGACPTLHPQGMLTGELDDSACEWRKIAKESIGRLGVDVTGGGGFVELRSRLRDIDFGALHDTALQILSRSEDARRSFEQHARGAEVEAGDSFFGEVGRRPELYRQLCLGLGFRTEQQTGLEIVGTALSQDGAIYPLRIPEEIKLIPGSKRGGAAEARFWNRAARSQLYAWTSASLKPEFRLVTEWGDRALELAWGMLFENLLSESLFLAAEYGFVESRLYRRARSGRRLLALRTSAAQLVTDLESCKSGTSLPERLERFTELTGDPSNNRDCGILEDPALRSADRLRAMALESQLRELLKSNFGARWWASRRAGDFLIDLWNTGQRYTAESLAASIGIGSLDYNWLLEDLCRED